jgi:uncharacterized membrane protein
MPVRKWTFLGIALLPIAIQQSISVSADVLSIAPVALALAIILRSYYEKREKYWKADLIKISILIAVATLAKPVMIAMILLIPFYKKKKALRESNYYVYLILAILTPLLLYLIWNKLSSLNNVSPSYIFSIDAQKSIIMHKHPVHLLENFLSDSVNFLLGGAAFNYFGSFEWLTSNSPALPVIFNYLGPIFLSIILITGYDTKEHLNFIKKRQIKLYNLAVIIVFAGIICADLYALFMIWTPIGANIIEGIQFRYYLAAFFVAGSTIGTKFLCTTEKAYRNFVIISSSFIFIVSLITIIDNYYHIF